MRPWLKAILVVLGLIAWTALVWFAGPFAGYGEFYPLDPAWPRLLLIFLVVGGVAAYYGFRLWRRRRAAKALEDAIKADEAKSGDGVVLGTRLSEALETLKRTSGKQTYLYELPWYVIIGPPGAGKTTALVKSGLKFPLVGPGGAEAVAGSGGTRYCDWWFTEDAVLIDTAGRYTTQDSNADTDSKSWLSFLGLIKQHRPKQPINGVILAISLEDVMTLSDAEVNEHAAAIRKRLLELHKELRIDFPVYALFTKADLVRGFAEFFGNFGETRRRKVWGATFQTEDRRKNLVGDVPVEFDALVKRLTEELPDRMHEEPDAIARIAIFGFPGQFAMLRDRVSALLSAVFEPTRYQVNANLRGFYFSSGTQEGTPIDQVLGVMGRNVLPDGGRNHYSGVGKSFFLYDLFKSVIFAEAGWVSQDLGAVRRSAAIRYGGMAAIGLVTALLLGVWGMSYYNNRALIERTEGEVEAYRADAAKELARTEIDRPDLESVVGYLDTLRSMPVGYDSRDEDAPWTAGFGLSQRPRLVSAASASYERALERMLRSRLILRLEQQIDAHINDPNYVYEALKVYLMLGGQAPKLEPAMIETWLQRDWEDDLLADSPPAVRKNLMEHVKAMLDLGASETTRIALSDDTVKRARQSLERMPVADRAYSVIKSIAQGEDLPPFSLADAGGSDMATVFETKSGKPVTSLIIPGLYTHSGFRDFLLGQLSDVAPQLRKETWVLGQAEGDSGRMDTQFRRLGNDVVERYSQEFIAEWEKALGDLRFKSMSAGGAENMALRAAVSQSAPVTRLFEAIANETALTRPDPDEADALAKITSDPDEAAKDANTVGRRLVDRYRGRAGGLAQIGIDLALSKGQRRASDAPDTPSNVRRPGATVENHFLPYRKVIEGEPGQRAIDAFITNLAEVQKNLVAATANPSQTAQTSANIQNATAALRLNNAPAMPAPFNDMIANMARGFESDALNASRNEVSDRLQNTLTSACSRIEGLYPFVRSSNREVPMGDFVRLFSPGGLIDGFFTQNLAQHVDTSGGAWVWKADDGFTQGLSRAALAQFQRAAEIRDAFFQNGSGLGFPVTITPQGMSQGVRTATLNIDGSTLQSQPNDTAPLSLQWPTQSGGNAALSITSGIWIGKSEVETHQSGPWALMKLVDAFPHSIQGPSIVVRIAINGFMASYRIDTSARDNPFVLKALKEFRCPDSL